MGVGPLVRWKDDEAAPLLRRLVVPAVLALVAALAIGALAGRVSLATTGGLALACWIAATTALDLKQRLLPAGSPLARVPARARMLPRAIVGMMAAHMGVAVFALGVAMVKSFEIERDVKMGPGDTTELAGYRFRMLSVRDVQGPNYVAAQGMVEVVRESDGRAVAMLRPEKRIYQVQQNPMTEAAVDSNALRDLYVSMGEQLPGGEWIVRVQHKPFIAWIWGGCLLMMLGGAIAASDRRYRRAGAKAAAAAALPLGPEAA
jgi:cytochrome c-type biogenesis protein CcmF